MMVARCTTNGFKGESSPELTDVTFSGNFTVDYDGGAMLNPGLITVKATPEW